MWSVAMPAYSAEESFTLCISRIRNEDLKQRLTDITDTIVAASAAYEAAAAQARLNEVATAHGVDGLVSGLEMVKVYTSRMAKKAAPGRVIYDAIMMLAAHGRCPFCGHRIVSTLDHLLAKTQHPALTVTPTNLAPSCSDCNKTKSDQPIATPADQYLHPYFDAIENDRWLVAEVIESQPASVRFIVEPAAGWSALTTERVANHFRRLGLSKLYASQAAEELINIRQQVTNLHIRTGAEGVRAFLRETRDSRSAARVNSWQSAFYSALADNDWYCDGGFG